MRKFLRLLVAATIVALSVFVSTPANAELSGNCTASGTFVKDGRTIDPKTTNIVEDIPRADDIQWKGTVTPSSTPRQISGFVKIDLPAPIPDISADTWSRSSAVLAENSGTYHWNLPSVVSGIDVRVYGTHKDLGTTCSGYVIVRVKGTSPILFASLALTILSLVGVVIAMRGKVAK